MILADAKACAESKSGSTKKPFISFQQLNVTD
jgi:hypothetical protein